MNHLKELRESRGLTQRELSRQAEVDVGNISRMESNKIKTQNITIGTLVKLSRILNCKIEDIVDFEEL